MTFSYPAKIKYIAEDKTYFVEFPYLPGCLTEGLTLEEVKQNAKEALTNYLSSVFDRNLKIPDPSLLRGKTIYNIELGVCATIRAHSG